MNEFVIEPDPGQQVKLEIDDALYSAYTYRIPVYIGRMKVTVLEYEFLQPLNYTSGHRARVYVERVD